MTWPHAYRIADDQIACWKRCGIDAGVAEQALRLDVPTRWDEVRRMLAAWVMAHKDRWEE